MAANATMTLISYHQAVFWRKAGLGVQVDTVSGLPDHDSNSPYLRWLAKLLAFLYSSHQKTDQPLAVDRDHIPKKLLAGWDEWSAGHGLWCPFRVNGRTRAGLWMIRDQPWLEAESALVNQLCKTYGHSHYILSKQPRVWLPSFNFSLGPLLLKTALLAALVSLLFLPIRLSVLAPAKIIALDPELVTSPLNGVIRSFHVKPNQQVTAGQLLFSLDDTELRTRHEVAGKALEVIKAEYRKSRQQSLNHSGAESDTGLLKAKISAKQAEVEYAAEELALIEVRANRDGIALFSDVNKWLGKPVVIGEKIFTLANPMGTEIEIQVPVDNAINLEPGAEVRMFLDIDPTRELRGTIRQTSFEAEISEEQILSFQVKAELDQAATPPRIGLRGTAKIFGKQTNLSYFLLRRPLASLRRTLGI